ncbi:hypothetical protein MYX04_08525 [Nitrospiraceae bacterium AH_259_D15_M11_P09]|nr:hypothetical protein [Nitrospiraceae bacterium AH_259_D15_M11_P09]
MHAFIKFNQGMMKMSTPARGWLLSLITVNLVVPLFFLERLEAQVVVGTLFISMMLMTGLTALTGFTRLLGLGHVLWIPMLFWLWTTLDEIPANDVFGIWVRALMVLNAISLVIDAVDVGRYLAGNREEVVKNLDTAVVSIVAREVKR